MILQTGVMQGQSLDTMLSLMNNNGLAQRQ